MSADKDKSDKVRMAAQVKHVPKDAQVIMSILRELNVQEYEPRVINQLLEFTYRYVTCILDDAKVFANHARKKTIELDDVKLATQAVLDKAFTCPPPRHVLAKLTEHRNSMPLPAIKPHCGLRLPPDRYCLIACNYKLRSTMPPKKMVRSALDSRSTLKTQFKTVAGTGGGGSLGGMKRATPTVAKQQVVSIPKPVLKFTTQAKVVETKAEESTDDLKMDVDVEDSINATAVGSIEVMTGDSGGSGDALKRDREEDDFEVVE